MIKSPKRLSNYLAQDIIALKNTIFSKFQIFNIRALNGVFTVLSPSLVGLQKVKIGFSTGLCTFWNLIGTQDSYLKLFINRHTAKQVVKLLGAKHYRIEKHNFLENLDIQDLGSERLFTFFTCFLVGLQKVQIGVYTALAFASKMGHK